MHRGERGTTCEEARRIEMRTMSLTSTLWGSGSIQKKPVEETRAGGGEGRREQEKRRMSTSAGGENQPWRSSHPLTASGGDSVCGRGRKGCVSFFR